MPTGVDSSRYEAFVVLSDEDSHGVIAIIGDVSGTQARPFVDVEHAAAAARLADALNSRLLGRPNHEARLLGALGGLPVAVQATVRVVPAPGEDDTDLLAEYLPGDPIDGLLLFADGPPTMTPRTAYALAFAAEDLGDRCHEAVQAITAQTAGDAQPRLPALIRRQRPEQLLRVAADLDRLAAALRDGIPPVVDTPAANLATRLTMDRAEQLHTENPDVLAAGSRLLPASPQDYDFDGLWRHLLDDATRPVSSPTT